MKHQKLCYIKLIYDKDVIYNSEKNIPLLDAIIDTNLKNIPLLDAIIDTNLKNIPLLDAIIDKRQHVLHFCILVLAHGHCQGGILCNSNPDTWRKPLETTYRLVSKTREHKAGSLTFWCPENVLCDISTQWQLARPSETFGLHGSRRTGNFRERQVEGKSAWRSHPRPGRGNKATRKGDGWTLVISFALLERQAGNTSDRIV